MGSTIGNAPSGEKTTLDGTEKVPMSGSVYGLISTIASFVVKYFASLTVKTTLANNDKFAISDSADSDNPKYITWVNIMTRAALFTQTLTNKTIDLASNTLTGTTAQFNTALSDDDFATLTNSVTLTNKTLTTPVITSPTGLHIPRIIRKPSNETVNNSGVQNDNDFLFSIAANEVWFVELFLLVTSVSTNADFVYDFTIPAGATQWIDFLSAGAGTGWGRTAVANSPAALGAATNAGSAANTQGLVLAGMVINAGTAGTVQFRWGQNTPTAENTVLLANSMMRYTRLA